MTDPSSTPAGWYPAPHANSELRYWDGVRWLDWTPEQAASAARSQADAARTTSYAGAVGTPEVAPTEVALESTPKKGSRWWIWLLIAVGAAVVIAIVIAAVSAMGRSGYIPQPKPPVSRESDDAAPEPSEEPAPEADPGTRENPNPYGEVITIIQVADDSPLWDIVVTAPTDVTDAIAAENQFNDPPANGSYIGVPVKATWQGEDPITPWTDWENGLEVAFVADDGRTFESSYVVAPWPDITDVADLYTGGVAEFTTVIDVPAGIAGAVRVSVGSSDFFFGG